MKKSVNVSLVIAVMFILVGLLFVNGCGKPADTYTEDQNQTYGDENPNQQQPTETPKEYKTSDKLSTITLTRDLIDSSGELSQHVSFKLSGYMKEIDPTSNDQTRYSDRAYTLDQGRIDWSIQELEILEGNNCRSTTTIGGEGNDSLSAYNVYYNRDGPQKDDNGNIVHLKAYNIKISYIEHGLNEQGKSELKILGSLLMPVMNTYVETKKTTNALCGGTDSLMDNAILQIPIKFIGFNPDQKTFSNSFEAVEGYENQIQGTITSGYKEAVFAYMTPVLVTEIPIPGNEASWKVSWNLEMP